MRLRTTYQIYLDRMEYYYKIKNMDVPEWIPLAKRYYGLLRNMDHMFHERSLSNATIEWLASLKTESLEMLPAEMLEKSKEMNCGFCAMYDALMEGKSEYFLYEWTLTRKGLHLVRDYIDKMPDINDIMPPKNTFTNIPNHISFANRLYAHEQEIEYKLSVSFSNSCLFLINGNANKRLEEIPFSESFLDSVIPLAQNERFEGLRKKNNCCESNDDSMYMDCKTVLVDLDWNKYDLNLTMVSSDNPFLLLLQLVWEEYAEVFKARNLLLPWFDYIYE